MEFVIIGSYLPFVWVIDKISSKHTGVAWGVWAILNLLVAILLIGNGVDIWMVAILIVLSMFTQIILRVVSEPRENIFRVPLNVKGGSAFIENVSLGVMVTGASGSGKTTSVGRDILKHFAKHNFAGLIYDYKDFELTELAGTLFKESQIKGFDIFALHEPELSVRINPVAPRFLTSENVLRGVMNTLFLNLEGEVKGERFFRDTAVGIAVGILWRLKKEYPQYCNIPFMVAMVLQVNALHDVQGNDRKAFAKLGRFIGGDWEAVMKSSSFVGGIDSEKQTASVYSTLANTLQKLDFPNLFYLLSKDEYDLDIFRDDNRRVLSVVNQPGVEEEAILPINSIIVSMAMNNARRGMAPAFLFIDEAYTLKLYRLVQWLATLRSFNVCTTYMIQGFNLVTAQWNGHKEITNSIATNLSTQFIGKINDTETAEYYEKFFEFVEIEQKSVSVGGFLGGGDKRVTHSRKERRKIRGYELTQLNQGRFVMLSGGVDHKIQFVKESFAAYRPPKLRSVTPEEIRREYQRICEEARNFISNF